MRRCLRKPTGWPRYMRSKLLASGNTAYFWEAPQWSRCFPNPPAVYVKALGQDYAVAKRDCDDVLNPMFDAWCETKHLNTEQRRKLYTTAAADRVPLGTFRWLAREFQKTDKFTDLDKTYRDNYRDGLALLSEYKLRKDTLGRTFGDLPLTSITALAVDELLKALKKMPNGKVRIRVVYKAMQAGRRAWNVTGRLHPKFVPALNPFAKTGFKAPRGGASMEATPSELHRFMAEADRRGQPSMAVAALIAWDWMLRERDLVGHLAWSSYRSGNRPTEIGLAHRKNHTRHGEVEILRMPLEDEAGARLFPELEDRLKALPRRGSLMIMRDQLDRFRKEHLPYKLNYFQKEARKILDAANLQHLKFESFRKGGETDCANAGLTDQEIMALDGHNTRDMLTIYAARNMQQRVNGMLKRRALRTKGG